MDDDKPHLVGPLLLGLLDLRSLGRRQRLCDPTQHRLPVNVNIERLSLLLTACIIIGMSFFEFAVRQKKNRARQVTKVTQAHGTGGMQSTFAYCEGGRAVQRMM